MIPYVNPFVLPLAMLGAWAVVAVVALAAALVHRAFVGRPPAALDRLAVPVRTPSSVRRAA
ncbi:MAG TPA: hypothetical protein VHF24_11180 [Acidimicrobiales bacterium]|nr:hypothetical protein [Acidimicrobiales bacterium]